MKINGFQSPPCVLPPIDSAESELLLHRLVECIGHKQNSLHAPLPTEPILEIYDKEEEFGDGDGEEWARGWWKSRITEERLTHLSSIKMCCDI